jgi:hypothetical protein
MKINQEICQYNKRDTGILKKFKWGGKKVYFFLKYILEVADSDIEAVQ